MDDVEHTFFRCRRWVGRQMELEFIVGEDINPESIETRMLILAGKIGTQWSSTYITQIMCNKETED